MNRKITPDMIQDNAKKCPLPVAGKWPPYQHVKACSCRHRREEWISESGGWSVSISNHGYGFWLWRVDHDFPEWSEVRSGESHSFEQAKLQGEAAAHIAWAIRNGCE